MNVKKPLILDKKLIEDYITIVRIYVLRQKVYVIGSSADLAKIFESMPMFDIDFRIFATFSQGWGSGFGLENGSGAPYLKQREISKKSI